MNTNFDTGSYLEYTSAANPTMPEIKPQVMKPNLDFKQTKISTIDLSKELSTSYPATTPNCLVNFINIMAYENIHPKSFATSNLFIVLSGSGQAKFKNGEMTWKQNDVFVIPFDETIVLTATTDSVLYWVNDEPILNYLGARPSRQNFTPTIFTTEKIRHYTDEFNKAEKAYLRNRNGILLGNKDCPLTKTITPSLWALYNIIEPNSTQLPHRHNSVALDLSLSAKRGVYTLMGKNVDDNGNIKNPQRFDWGNGISFITPPGWWHSHHNESDEKAIVLPVQDAGLQTYMRTLFIQFWGK